MSADTPTPPAGFDSDEELQVHLAALERDSPAEDPALPFEGRIGERTTLGDLQSDISLVRVEMEHLRARLHIIAGQSETLVRSQLEWADASAHAQLGRYPWLKLVGAMTGTFLATRFIQTLPFGSLLTAVLPHVAAVSEHRHTR